MNGHTLDIPKSSPSLRVSGRAKSCTRCRQAKLACDARRNLNQPCSRCRSKNFDCRFNANFKRISIRKLSEEISHGLHALRPIEQTRTAERGALNAAQNVEVSYSLPQNENRLLSVEPPLFGTSPQRHTLQWLNIIKSDMARSYHLRNLNLESQTVIELFQHFGLHYQPYAMFLEPLTSISDLHARSPLLFWTIILVASQDNDRFAAVYQDAAKEHKELLSPILQRAIQRVETIHALLLLCLWPIPQSRHFNNPAWNYVGLAIHAAMQLDCHNPVSPNSEIHGWTGLGLVAVGELNTIEQAKTWLGCFWVGTVIATFYGMRPPMSTQQQLRSIDKALDTISDSIPSWWATLFSIVKITNSVMDTLGNIEDHALHFSLTQMFDDQLDELRKKNSDSWRSEIVVEWCNAKMYLYALIFTIPTHGNLSHNGQTQIHRQAILHKVLDVASNLINELTKLGLSYTSDLYPSGLLSFVPNSYFTSLFNATTFLFRFMATYVTRTPAQENLAFGLTVEAHKIFQSFPGKRELTRAAIHIEILIDVLRYGTTARMDELVVNNKLGASVLFDAVFQACRQRNIDPDTGRVLPVQEWKTVNEVFAQRLPEGLVQKIRADNERNNAVTGYDSTSLELDQRISVSEVQEATWWEEWEDYMDLFQVRVEQLGGTDMEQSTEDNDNLGEIRGFAHA